MELHVFFFFDLLGVFKNILSWSLENLCGNLRRLTLWATKWDSEFVWNVIRKIHEKLSNPVVSHISMLQQSDWSWAQPQSRPRSWRGHERASPSPWSGPVSGSWIPRGPGTTAISCQSRLPCYRQAPGAATTATMAEAWEDPKWPCHFALLNEGFSPENGKFIRKFYFQFYLALAQHKHCGHFGYFKAAIASVGEMVKSGTQSSKSSDVEPRFLCQFLTVQFLLRLVNQIKIDQRESA